jgi:hypothetical protein
MANPPGGMLNFEICWRPVHTSCPYQGAGLGKLSAFACEPLQDLAFDNYPIASYMQSGRPHNANVDKNSGAVS